MWAISRTVKFVVKAAFKSYLMDLGDVDLDLFSLDAEVAVVENVRLNCDAVNRKLSNSFNAGPLPIKIIDGKAKSIKVRIPWRTLNVDGPHVTLNGLSLVVQPQTSIQPAGPPAVSQTTQSSTQRRRPTSWDEEDDEEANDQNDEGGALGSIDVLLHHLIEDLQITIENLTVTLQSAAGASLPSSATLSLASLSYRNPNEKTEAKQPKQRQRDIQFGQIALSVNLGNTVEEEVARFSPRNGHCTVNFVSNERGNVEKVTVQADLGDSAIDLTVKKTQLDALTNLVTSTLQVILVKPEKNNSAAAAIPAEMTQSVKYAAGLIQQAHQTTGLTSLMTAGHDSSSSSVLLANSMMQSALVALSPDTHAATEQQQQPVGLDSELKIGRLRLVLLSRDDDGGDSTHQPFVPLVELLGIVIHLQPTEQKTHLSVARVTGVSIPAPLSADTPPTTITWLSFSSLSITATQEQQQKQQQHSNSSTLSLEVSLSPVIFTWDSSVITSIQSFLSSTSSSHQPSHVSSSVPTATKLSLHLAHFSSDFIFPSMSFSLSLHHFLLSFSSVSSSASSSFISVSFSGASLFISSGQPTVRRKLLDVLSSSSSHPSLQFSLQQSSSFSPSELDKQFQARKSAAEATTVNKPQQQSTAATPPQVLRHSPAIINMADNYTQTILHATTTDSPSTSVPPSPATSTPTAPSPVSLSQLFSKPFLFFSSSGLSSFTRDSFNLDSDQLFSSSKLSLDFPAIILDIHPSDIALLLSLLPLFSSESSDMMSLFINIHHFRLKLHHPQDPPHHPSSASTFSLTKCKSFIIMNYFSQPSSTLLFLNTSSFHLTDSSSSLLFHSLHDSLPQQSFPAGFSLLSHEIRLSLFDGSQLFLNKSLVSPILSSLLPLAHILPSPPVATKEQPPQPQQPQQQQMKGMTRRLCFLLQSAAAAEEPGSSLLVVLDGVDFFIEKTTTTAAAGATITKFHGPHFRRLRLFFRPVSSSNRNIGGLPLSPVQVLNGSCNPLKQEGWTQLVSWPPKKSLGINTSGGGGPSSSSLQPVFILDGQQIDGQVDLLVRFNEAKPVKIKLPVELVFPLRMFIDSVTAPLLKQLTVDTTQEKEPGESMNIEKYVIPEYEPSVAIITKTPGGAGTGGALLLLDERDKGYEVTDEQQQLPPLPKEIVDNLPVAPENKTSEEEEEEEFFDAKESFQTEEEEEKKEEKKHIAVTVETLAVIVCLVQQKKQEKEKGDRVVMNLGVEMAHLRMNSEAEDGQLAVHGDVKVGSVVINSPIKKSAWKTLLAIDTERLQKWNKDKQHQVRRQPDDHGPMEICYEKRRLSEHASSIRLTVMVQPLRVYLTQATLLFLLPFVEDSLFRELIPSQCHQSAPKAAVPTQLFVESLHVSPIGVKLDYKPQSELPLPKLNIEGYYWAFRFIPKIQDASYKLPAVDYHGQQVMLASEIGHALQQAWAPSMGQIVRMMGGIRPVHVALRVGKGVVSLVRIPISQYNEDGDIIKGIGKGFQSMSVEFLDMGSRATLSVVRLLHWTDEVVTGGSNTAEASMSDSPSSIASGGAAAAGSLVQGVARAAHGVLYQPVIAYCSTGVTGFISAFARNVPGLVIRPVLGATDAVAQVLLSLRNSMDPSRHQIEAARYRPTTTATSPASSSATRRASSTVTMSALPDHYFQLPDEPTAPL